MCLLQTFGLHSHDPERERLQTPRRRQRQSRSHNVLEGSQLECCPPSIDNPARSIESDRAKYGAATPYWTTVKSCFKWNFNLRVKIRPEPCCFLEWEWWFLGCSGPVPNSMAHTCQTKGWGWLVLIGLDECLSNSPHNWEYRGMRCPLKSRI